MSLDGWALTQGGWLTALLAMDRARSAAEFREAMRPWHVPTFSRGLCRCRRPHRLPGGGPHPAARASGSAAIGPGWDPRTSGRDWSRSRACRTSQDPARGWMVTANNRPAPDDFPYPLSGTWGDAARAAAFDSCWKQDRTASIDSFRDMQQDALSLRARGVLADLSPALEASRACAFRKRSSSCSDWDGHMEADRIGATLFEVFFVRWVRRVVRERFEGEAAGLLAGGGMVWPRRCCEDDPLGWFQRSDRADGHPRSDDDGAGLPGERLGPDMSGWQWGRLHVMPLRHMLSGRGDLGRLLDQGGVAVKGDADTVCNTGVGGQFEARRSRAIG